MQCWGCCWSNIQSEHPRPPQSCSPMQWQGPQAFGGDPGSLTSTPLLLQAWQIHLQNFQMLNIVDTNFVYWCNIQLTAFWNVFSLFVFETVEGCGTCSLVAAWKLEKYKLKQPCQIYQQICEEVHAADNVIQQARVGNGTVGKYLLFIRVSKATLAAGALNLCNALPEQFAVGWKWTKLLKEKKKYWSQERALF